MWVQQDMILNGQGYGEVAEALMGGLNYDTNLARPYYDERDGQLKVTQNTGRFDGKGKAIYRTRLAREMVANGLVINGPTSLRKLEWVRLDQVVLRAARERLRAWTDLASVASFGGFNGMTSTMLEHEVMSDAGSAQVDMDGLSEGVTDAPLFQLQGVPLPITHSSFWFSARKLAISRNSGTPLDLTMGEMAGRRVAETIEKTLIGTLTGMTYAGGGGFTYTHGSSAATRNPTVYGYTNFPQRLTLTTLTAPTTTNQATTLAQVLSMLTTLYNQNFYGPFMLYHDTDWDNYMDNDYILTGGNVATQTLRNRLRAIEGISDVRRLDFLKGGSGKYNLLLVQMTSEVAQAVDGMPITTVQWESKGGARLNFRVMCIQVPRLRADYNDNCGILHATTS